jgi:hypothetical protein
VDGGGLESRLASLLQNHRRLGWDVGATQVAIQRPGMRQTGGVEHGEAAIATCVAPTKPPALGVRRSQSRLASLLQNRRRLGWDVQNHRSDASRDRAARDAANRRRRARRGCYRDLRRSYKTAGARGAAAGIATCVAPTKPSALGVGRGSDASRDRAARDAANRRRRAWRGCYRDLRRSYETQQRTGCGGRNRDLRRSYKTTGAWGGT